MSALAELVELGATFITVQRKGSRAESSWIASAFQTWPAFADGADAEEALTNLVEKINKRNNR